MNLEYGWIAFMHAETFDLLARRRNLALSLMFWNNIDAAMIHLLAEMYDYGIHELSRRQGRYMQAEIFDKVNKYNSFVS